MPLPFIIALGFAIAVMTVWYRLHFISTTWSDWLTISFPLIVFTVVFGPIVAWLFHQYRDQSWTPRPITVLGVVFFLSIFIINTEVFLVGILPYSENLLPLSSWLTANVSYAQKLLAVFATFIGLTVIWIASGNLLMRHITKLDERTDYNLFLRLTIGIGVWSALLLSLGLVDQLNFAAIWTVILLVLALEWRFLFRFVRALIAPIHQAIPLSKLTVAMLAIGFFFAAFHITETLRPHPTGYDDMTYYMNRVNLMSEEGALVPGGNPYPFELLSAALRIATRDDTLLLAMSLGVYGLLLGAFVIFRFGHVYFGMSVGIVAAAITLTLPMGTALALGETKPDALLLPVATLFFWSLLRAVQERKFVHVYAAAFLLGLAVAIKLTALFLVIPFVIGMALFWMVEKRTIGNALRTLAITVLFFCLSVLPWIGYGYSTKDSTRPLPFRSLLSGMSQTQAPSLGQEVTELLRSETCEPTGATEDFARFRYDRPALQSTLYLPWDITMNQATRLYATETSPLFLALIPIGLVFMWYRRRETDIRTLLTTPVVQISLLALGYFIAWSIWAKFIPWYGYPGVALLALLVAHFTLSGTAPLSLRILLTTLLILGIIGGGLIQLKSAANSTHLLYASGTLDATTYLDTRYPGFGEAMRILNADPNARVYLGASRFWYGIDRNTERAYMDSHLDTFHCLFEKYGSDGTLTILRSLDIRYVLFSRAMLQELKTGNTPTLQTKIARFTEFVSQNLDLVWGSPNHMIFRVP